MRVDHLKLGLSLLSAALILAFGLLRLSLQSPQLTTRPFNSSITSSQYIDQVAEEETINNQAVNDQNTSTYSSIDPNNAKIEVETMTVSIDSYNKIDNRDWSLDQISDHALGITR